MEKLKKYNWLIWLVVLLGFGLWITGGDISEVVSSFGVEFLKCFGCFILFGVVFLAYKHFNK